MSNGTFTAESLAIRSAFSTLNEKIGFVKLNEISSGLSNKAMPLLDIVVPLRSDITISAVVDENGLKKVLIHRVGSTERPIATIENGKLIESTTIRTKIRINDDFVESIFGTTQIILDGKETKGLSIRHRPLIYSPIWTVGEKKEFADIDLLSAANLFQYVVVLGSPGSGKTTTAKAIAAEHYKNFLGETQTKSVSVLGLWKDEDNFPIYIELKSLVSDSEFPAIDCQPPNIEFFKKYIKKHLFNDNDTVMNYVFDKMQQGKALLILDGLDEIPFPIIKEGAIERRHNQLNNLIRSIKTIYPKIKIIVTSRPAGYSNWTLEGFEIIHIRPLSTKEAANLANSYYMAAGIEKDESKDLTKKLIVEIERLPIKIREYPLFICLLASLFRDQKGEFPAKRGGLLQVSLDTLLGTWTVRRHEGKTLQDILNCSPEQIVKCLSQISFRALTEDTQGSSDTPDVSTEMALGEFYSLGNHVNPAQVLDYITTQAGILTSPAQKRLRFVHRLFQEYLAALAISNQQNNISEMTKLVVGDPRMWMEVALLFADILSNKKLYGELLFFIEALLSKIETCCHNAEIITLVASIVVEEDFHTLDVCYKESASIRTCIDKLQKSLLLTCLNGKQRSLIGRALSELGDIRKGISLSKDELPEFCWETINAGTFLMGSGDNDSSTIMQIAGNRKWNLDREKPQCEIRIASFKISRYLVTNEQFNAFVLATDGYACDKWWTVAGKIWKDNNSPPPTLSSLPKNSPQNCVTWFEAVAFCRWYSNKTNKNVRLPTEAEWEYVARGTKSFQYVWGDECNSSFANVKEADMGYVSPVGCFPTDIKSHADLIIYDLNGNIWEWCSSIVEDDQGNKFSYPYNSQDGREDYEKDEHYFRATRGGYYDGGWMHARSCYRGRDIPNLRVERQGFRVVRDIK